MFVVRYDGNDEDGPGFNHLKPHEDESIISLNTIALNDERIRRRWIIHSMY